MKQLIRNHQNTSSSSTCIDTPANMNRSSVKQACNYMIANKVRIHYFPYKNSFFSFPFYLP